MTTASIQYGTPAAVTCTLASLAASATAGQESAAVDNTSALAVDYMAGGKITTQTPTANTQIEVWVNASYDGTTWAAGGTGTNAALTPVQNAKFYMRQAAILTITATTANVTHSFVIGSIANLFGGIVPQKFNFWILNNSGAALNATAGNHELKVVPINYTSA